jgi:hypothetical protein
MRIQLATALLVSAIAAPAVAGEGQTGEGGTAADQKTTRVIIGGGLGGGFGAHLKKNGRTTSFDDVFQGATDKSPLVAVTVATFGIALKPGLYAGLDLSGMAQAGNFAGNTTTAIQIINYFGALTWFPWESGLYLRGGAGFSSFAQADKVNGTTTTEHAGGLGVLIGAGYALQLTGAHHLTLTAEQTWQSYGGSGINKPDSSRVGAVYLGYLYKN